MIGVGLGDPEPLQSDHLILGSTWRVNTENKSRIKFVSGKEFYQ